MNKKILKYIDDSIKNKPGLSAFVLLMGIFVFAGSIAFGWDTWRNRSKFAVGDCVEVVYETEFYRSVYYNRVDIVGERGYMTSRKQAGDDHFFDHRNFEWKFSLNERDKVDPKLCEVK